MTAKLATESQWKSVAQKHKVKDNGLQKALAEYERLGDEKPQDKAKALDMVKKLVSTLTKDKAVAANTEVAKFLDGLDAGAEQAKKAVAAQAKEQDAQRSELQDVCAETGKLVRSGKDQVADLAKGGGGPCEDCVKDLRLATIRAETALARALAALEHRDTDPTPTLRALDDALGELHQADEALQRCQRGAAPDASYKPLARQLQALRDRLARGMGSLRR